MLSLVYLKPEEFAAPHVVVDCTAEYVHGVPHHSARVEETT